MTYRNTVAIVVENKSRELHGKIWLALNFLEAGDFRVILGEERQLKHNIFEIAPDFLLLNSVRWPEKIHKISKTGCLIASLNEEGNIFERKEDYYQRVNSVDLYDFVDLQFVPGQAHADIIQERASSWTDNIVITGNPRFDLLRPELRDVYDQRSEQLTDEHGRYALVNTNFVWANRIGSSIAHAKMNNDSFDIQAICNMSNVEDNLSPDKVRYNIRLVELFVEAIQRIAKMDTLDTVIIRPHPSKEDHSFYQARFDSLDSVVIETSGDARKSIHAAHVVIQNGCTTGVEAALMNQPVIAYEPEIDIGTADRKSVPNRVSRTVHTVDDLIETIDSISVDSRHDNIQNEQYDQLSRRFASLEDVAAGRIVSTVCEKISPVTYSKRLQLQSKLARTVRDFIPKAPNHYRFSAGQKYPGTTQDEIYDFISDLQCVQAIPDVEVRNLSNFEEIYVLNRNN